MNSETNYKPNSRVASITFTRTIVEKGTILVPIDTPETAPVSLVKKAAIQAAEKALFHANEVEYKISAIGSVADVTEVYYVDEDGDIEVEDPLII